MSQQDPLRLGVSSCLLGNEVRFDAGHKKNSFVAQDLAPFVEWVVVCPEVEVGMPIPRPALRLETEGDQVRMREIRSGQDHTVHMQRYAKRKVAQLGAQGIDGYILKKDSPSCGMERVRLRDEQGQVRRAGRGLFAAALMQAFPQLPVEEEGRLQDPRLRENFIERLFAQRRLRRLFEGRWSAGDVVRFHTAHKLQLMAHSPQAYRSLGRQVAEVRQGARTVFRDQYCEEFSTALKKLATPGRVTNVLQHMAGYLRKHIPDPERAELTETIEDYRQGLLPLVVPLTLLRHHARAQEIEYLLGQTFLDPHPKELMLRNRV